MKGKSISDLNKLVESVLFDFAHDFVDPKEALLGPDGEFWHPLGSTIPADFTQIQIFTRQGHQEIRRRSRYLAAFNEFWINAQTNRVNYTVGRGFKYEVMANPDLPDDEQPGEEETRQAQAVVNAFLKSQKWGLREREMVWRADRDGECFFRFFETDEGIRVRFVEPEHVATPTDARGVGPIELGIETEPDDVETVLAYWVKGERIPAEEIIHIKMNAGFADPRGIPTSLPVWKNLLRAEKLLRNMSTVAGIQAAIALIRKHTASKEAVETFVDRTKDASQVDPVSGRQRSLQRFSSAEVIDAPKGTEYDFPAKGTNAEQFVEVLNAELRAIASRLNMPEFMLTSNAANANYASTLVSEGPVVKCFKALQDFFGQLSGEPIIRRVLLHAETMGDLPRDLTERLSIKIDAPMVEVRDRLKLSQAFEIERNAGVRSPQSWAREVGLDYDREQDQLHAHEDANPDSGGSPFGIPQVRTTRGGLRPDGT